VSQIIVDTNLCKGDGVCVAVCPARVLALNEEGFPEELPDTRCILCGHCVAVCPNDALTHTGLPQEAFLPASKNLPDPAMIDGFLNSRRSVREFKDQPVARETLDALLDVARRAPTASNSQKLHWIVVGGGDKVRALCAEAMNSLNQRKSSLARDGLLIEYRLAEALRRTGKGLAKLHDLYAERTFSVPECKSMYLHSIKRDALPAVARLEYAVFRWGFAIQLIESIIVK
jgi:NAD-dependent dihydropyrimidine dehydrogenase PreA subunit